MENVKRAALSFEQEYLQKVCTAVEAASIVTSGNYLSLPIGVGEPTHFVRALAARKRELQEVVINQQHPLSPDFFTEDSVPHIKVNTWFTSPVARKAVQKGWADFVPNNFHEGPRLLREYWQIDIAGTVVSPMDEHGYFTCSLAVAYTMEAVKKAKKVVVQVNPHAPRTLGNCRIHISEVDYIIECNEPLHELTIPPITPIEEAIGGYIAELVEDGSCLQLGVGGIPNSVCKSLLHKKDLGIHTELFSDGMVDLMLSGAVNNSRKQTHRGKTVATLALGTGRLYEFMHDNPLIEMHPVDYVTDPYNIGKNDNMVAINATIEVDLLGQCCSESIGHLQYSGTGGQADFARGANISRGGKGFITTASTAKKGTVSCIVPTLTPGAAVTTGKNDVDYVVTEYGVANLRFKSIPERAKALIAIAHPQFREELQEEAKKHGWL